VGEVAKLSFNYSFATAGDDETRFSQGINGQETSTNRALSLAAPRRGLQVTNSPAGVNPRENGLIVS
jgi:hypothetical protein